MPNEHALPVEDNHLIMTKTIHFGSPPMLGWLNRSATIVDVEVTGAQRNKGHPFDPRNKTVLFGALKLNVRAGTGELRIWKFDSTKPSNNVREQIKHFLQDELLVGFNIKFDLHWMRREGLWDPTNAVRDITQVWDVQYGYYLLKEQRIKMPSLNDVLEHFELPPKLDVIKTEYWDKGIDTDQIPERTLVEYLEGDLRGTQECYFRVAHGLTNTGRMRLMIRCMLDLLVLQEMEWNGFKYDVKKSQGLAQKCQGRIAELDSELSSLLTCPEWITVNWTSDQQLSAVLYGGPLKTTIKVEDGKFKTGTRAGQPKYRKEVRIYHFGGYFRPPKRKLKTEGQYPTDEATLSQLPKKGTGGKIVKLVLELKRLQKLNGTYYMGIPEKFEKFGWQDETIHHSLNQVVAITGRLSSSNPNLQNADAEVKECFVSRFKEWNYVVRG